jgi:hypothetical protein
MPEHDRLYLSMVARAPRSGCDGRELTKDAKKCCRLGAMLEALLFLKLSDTKLHVAWNSNCRSYCLFHRSPSSSQHHDVKRFGRRLHRGSVRVAVIWVP